MYIVLTKQKPSGERFFWTNEIKMSHQLFAYGTYSKITHAMKRAQPTVKHGGGLNYDHKNPVMPDFYRLKLQCAASVAP